MRDALDEYVAAHGPFTADDWLEICYPLARTIQAMHNRNILHRSLRPACVLLRYTKSADGRRRPVVKLADAGLSSRPQGAATPPPPTTATRRRTPTPAAGAVARMIGYYLPPEVIGLAEGRLPASWAGPQLGHLRARATLAFFRPDRAGPTPASPRCIGLTGRLAAQAPRTTSHRLDHQPPAGEHGQVGDVEGLEALAPPGFVHDMERAQQGAAVAAHSAALAEDPDDLVARTQRGIAYLRQGEFAQAVADLTEALRRAPNDASLYRRRAQARQRLGDHAAAILDYTESLRIEPRSVEALTARGLAQAAAGEHDLAILDFTEGIKVAPRDEALHGNRGNSYFVKGDVERAIADYSQVLRLDPRNVTSFGNRGRAFLMQARRRPKQAVEIDFSTPCRSIRATCASSSSDRGAAAHGPFLGKAERGGRGLHRGHPSSPPTALFLPRSRHRPLGRQ